jgi:phospholipase C
MRSFAAIAAIAATASALPYTKRSSSYGNGTAPISNPEVWANLRSKIKHVVYLVCCANFLNQEWL